jgi:hypothetical protein
VKVDWENKEEWRASGISPFAFSVTVTRHEVAPMHDENRGPHRWCVYAWIYPGHPRFKRFTDESIFQAAATELPLHGGVIATATLVRKHYDAKGDVTSVQVGSDYSHLHDERFTHMATRDEASEVFRDAERLIQFLKAENSDDASKDSDVGA